MIPQNLMVYRRFPHFFVARIGGVPNFQTGFMSRSPKLQVYTKLTPFSFVMGISRISQESWLVNNHGYPIWAYYPSKQLRSSGVLLYTKEGLHDQGWVVQPLHSRLSILTRWCPIISQLSCFITPISLWFMVDISIPGWWFGTCFPYIGNNHPNRLIFFRGVETTNQYTYYGL